MENQINNLVRERNERMEALEQQQLIQQEQQQEREQQQLLQEQQKQAAAAHQQHQQQQHQQLAPIARQPTPEPQPTPPPSPELQPVAGIHEANIQLTQAILNSSNHLRPPGSGAGALGVVDQPGSENYSKSSKSPKQNRVKKLFTWCVMSALLYVGSFIDALAIKGKIVICI